MTAQGVSRAERQVSAGRRKPSADAVALEDVVIGKDVLELLSSAMYVDPMTIYREYVQNAADAIDDARREGILAEDERGTVAIAIDPASRSIRIRDNGSGVAWPEFARKLTALGASGKRGKAARGFRGVGRLAGLGYAQELVFRSRTVGEKLVSELCWDCRRLKAALRAADEDSGVVALIRSIVSVDRVDAEGYPEHFFEVELKGIIRLRSDPLMNPTAISDYLGQVAPVPFSPEFTFGAEISDALRVLVGLGELEIRIDDQEEPIYRPHRNAFVVDEKRTVTFESVDIIEVAGIDGEPAALAWILHHDYEGAIPTGTLVKGLRLRSGNVQVGDHALLEDLFPEPRFNVWSVGEVHVIDRRIVPNGRRDHFEQNAHFHNLLNHLTPTAREIARHCRTSSIKRKWLREFELQRGTVSEKIGVIQQGSLSSDARKSLVSSAEPAFQKMAKIADMELLAEEQPEQLKKVIVDLRSNITALMQDGLPETSPLAQMPAERRLMYEHLFDLVYDCSANRLAAKALVDRILERLRAEIELNSHSIEQPAAAKRPRQRTTFGAKG